MDVSFTLDNVAFVQRTAAVLIRDGKVLLETSDGVDFWTLPGGKVALMETSLEALSRELTEELGISLSNPRLLWVTESFYSCKYKNHHEITFYYRVELPDGAETQHLTSSGEAIVRPDKPGDTENLTFAWHNIDTLAEVNLLPEFLKAGIKHMPEKLEHIVHLEGPRL